MTARCRGRALRSRGVAPERRRHQDVAVARTRGVSATHIRSGALTPSSVRPFASVCRAAAHSHRRAMLVSVNSSSARGSTRHES